MAGSRVRAVLGGPWMKLVGEEIPLSRETLRRMGQALVDSIVVEARRDMTLVQTGHQEELPRTADFLASFSYRLVGKRTIEIVSTWPWIDQLIEGRDPYPMKWLTQERGVHHVPMLQPDGRVLIRTAPLRTANAWIHPGFARHTFIERAVRKARKEHAKILAEEVQRAMAETMR